MMVVLMIVVTVRAVNMLMVVIVVAIRAMNMAVGMRVHENS